MKAVGHIARKELEVFFQSPVAYIILFVFAFLSGIFFYTFIREISDAALVIPYLLNFLKALFLMAIPFFTMRLLAEEKRSGTLEILQSLPVSDLQIVTGKFLGSFLFFLMLLSFTLVHLLVILIAGRPDAGMLITSYLGMFLLGGAMISIGLATSAMSRNQIVSAMLCFLVLIMLWLMEYFAGYSTGGIQSVLRYLSIFGHFKSFNNGLIHSGDVVFYLSLILFNLFLSSRLLGVRK